MESFITSVLAFITAIAILIAFHEFGHFWVARKAGVKVLRFSIGFGKPLWMKRAGPDQTEYVLAAIPLGGYVKMLDEREGEVPESELHRAFNRQSVAKRIAIVSAGPVFNFIFAIFAYMIMYMMGVNGIKPVIGEVEAESVAYQAGLRANDEIISVDGELTPTWNIARLALLQSSLENDDLTLEVKGQDSSVQRVKIPVSNLSTEVKQNSLLAEVGVKPYRPEIPAKIGKLDPEGAAQRDGIQVGDKIVSVNGDPVVDWMGWVKVIQDNPEKTLSVGVDRKGELVDIELTPKAIDSSEGTIGRIGAMPEPVEFPKEFQTVVQYSIGTALYTGVVKTWQMSILTLRMIGHMIIGDVSVKNLSGPITIATYAGYTASEGLTTFLSFLAIVSISLGVLNLLPIPLLDGGHLLLYFIEIVKGKALSEETQMKMQRVGIVMLGMLMVLAFYNDIQRLFWG